MAEGMIFDDKQRWDFVTKHNVGLTQSITGWGCHSADFPPGPVIAQATPRQAIDWAMQRWYEAQGL